MERLSDQFWTTVVPDAATFAQGNGRQEELGSVYGGARSAQTFIAQYFLPTTPEAAALKGASGRAKG